MKTTTLLAILALGLLAFHVRAQQAYSNYDFVPGEKIIFEDNLADSPDGEFPSRWNLVSGQGVVNKSGGEPALVLTEGNYAKVEPAITAKSYLGNSFTIEFDLYSGEGANPVLVFFKDAEGDDGKSISFGTSGDVGTNYFENDLTGTYKGDMADKQWHHVALAFKDQQIKCYVDQFRVLVIPKCGFSPVALRFGGMAELRFRNVKIAEGGGMNMLGKILTDGRLVTHSITFDISKSTIKPESMGFLNELAKWVKENATVKLEIDGHTDNTGDAANNLKLSQARADAVKAQLVSIGIDGSRLTTKGFGASKPSDDNATPEGRALNRRVEFVKQ